MTDSSRSAVSNGDPASPAPCGEAPRHSALPTTTEEQDGAPPPNGYDPPDYRWVPVRRRPRHDGWTEEKQRRFIEVLADTGLVSAAARAVGMSREGANRLRRSPHGAAFARAWDAARHHAGGALEDIAFERAIEGVEHDVFDEYGEVVCTRRAYNDRLLMWLLSRLKPERYGSAAAEREQAGHRAQSLADETPAPPPEIALDMSLRALEPPLPAPPEQLLGSETLADELELADIADGDLPHFLTEQRPSRSAASLQAAARAAEEARGAEAWDKLERREAEFSAQELTDLCRHVDPAGRNERSRRRYR